MERLTPAGDIAAPYHHLVHHWCADCTRERRQSRGRMRARGVVDTPDIKAHLHSARSPRGIGITGIPPH